MRRLLQGHLDLRSQLESRPLRLVGAEEKVRTHHRRRSRNLSSVFGLVNVARTVIGGRGLTGVAPMDAELNLPKTRYSFGLERCVVDEAVRGSFDEAVTRCTGARVPKGQAEQVIRRVTKDFEVFYVAGGGQLSPVADGPEDLLVLTVDGKGVTMRPDSLRQATREAAARRTHKLKRRLSSGEKRNRRRMATVASVSSIAPQPRTTMNIVCDLRPVRDVARPKRPRPKNKRVWASVALDAETVMEDMFAETLRRDPARVRRWVAVVDGTWRFHQRQHRDWVHGALHAQARITTEHKPPPSRSNLTLRVGGAEAS